MGKKPGLCDKGHEFRCRLVRNTSVKQHDEEFIILNVYAPYECHHNEEDHLSKLAYMNSFMQNEKPKSIYVMGDMNADISDKKLAICQPPFPFLYRF